MIEALQDGVFLSSMERDIPAEGIVGAFSKVGDEEMAGADPRVCSGRAEVVLVGAVFGGACVMLEGRSGDELCAQRMVHLEEQVFVGEMDCFSPLSIVLRRSVPPFSFL